MKKKVKTPKAAAPKTQAPAAKAGANLDAEAYLLEVFPAETVEAIKALIVESFKKGPGSFVFDALQKAADEEPAEAPAAKSNQSPKGFQVHRLDEDEETVGAKAIKAAAKALKNVEFKPIAWVVVIDGQQYSPRAIYRQAFENEGFNVDWEYNTHKALSWLEHHGFPVQRA